MKHIFALPVNTADTAIYIPSGTIPIKDIFIKEPCHYMGIYVDLIKHPLNGAWPNDSCQ